MEQSSRPPCLAWCCEEIHKGYFRSAFFCKVVAYGFCFFTAFLSAAAGAFQDATNLNRLSLVELQSKLAASGRVIQSFQVEGVVCAIVPHRNMLVLQDESGSLLLEVPAINSGLQVGDRLVVEGRNCPMNRIRYGIQAGTAPVVDNDGTHAEMEKSGGVFLDEGLNPILVEWFNSFGNFSLNLAYEGPGISRQKIPASVLWHHPSGGS